MGLVCFLLVSPILPMLQASGEEEIEEQWSLEGDWLIDEEVCIQDQIIELNGNLTILDGGKLELDNCSLLFNCSFYGEYELRILDGGALFLYGTRGSEGGNFSPGASQLIYVGFGTPEDSGVLAYRYSDVDGDHAWEFIGQVEDEEGNGDWGSYTYNPVLADLDGDMDNDLILGNSLDYLIYLENTGTEHHPEWTRNHTLFDGIESDHSSVPEFADLDGDDDLDLIIGESNGRFSYYENVGNKRDPVWEEDEEMFRDIDMGYDSHPELVDLDGDGDLDLVAGCYGYELFYFENTGDQYQPEWTQKYAMFEELPDLYMYSVELYDNDRDGDYDLTIGSSWEGPMHYFENTGSPNEPEWTQITGMYNSIEGMYRRPAFPPGTQLGHGWENNLSSSGDGCYGFIAEPGSIIEIKDTEIMDCRPLNNDCDGLKILTDSSVLTGNLFKGGNSGIVLENVNDFQVTDNYFMHNNMAVDVIGGDGGIIFNNSFINGNTGISFTESQHGVISGNKFQDLGNGVLIRDSKTMEIQDNEFRNCGLILEGSVNEDLLSHSVYNNSVNGKPLRFITYAKDAVITGEVGQLILVNCSNVTITDLDLVSTDIGLQMIKVRNSGIQNNTLSKSGIGIRLYDSDKNEIVENDISKNGVGILLEEGCEDNLIKRNRITGNKRSGMDASENGLDPVRAVWNFWGGSDGPYHPDDNPLGTGDNVTEGISFHPWLNAEPGHNIWYVDHSVNDGGNGSKENPFTRIMDAVKVASSGENILVTAGTYSENLILDRQLGVYGVNGIVTLDASGGTGVQVLQEITMANFSLVNASKDLIIMKDTRLFNTNFSTMENPQDYNISIGYYLDVQTLNDLGDPVAEAIVSIRGNGFEEVSYNTDGNGRCSGIPLVTSIRNATSIHVLDCYYVKGLYTMGYDLVNISLTSNAMILLNLTARSGFGRAITSGDWNSDGFMDVAVGAPYHDHGGEDIGAIYVFFGPVYDISLRPSEADIIVRGAYYGCRYGYSLASGKINNDDEDDLIVGMPGPEDNGGEYCGEVHVYYSWYFNDGYLHLDEAYRFTATQRHYGKHVSAADYDQDGYPEILAGYDGGTRILNIYPSEPVLEISSWANTIGLNNGGPSVVTSIDGLNYIFSTDPDGIQSHTVQYPEHYTGEFNNTYLFPYYPYGLTLDMYERIDIVPNGDFDDGWNNWTRTTNRRDENHGQWKMTSLDDGDWRTNQGSTVASLGPQGLSYLYLDGQYHNNSGMLVSEPFTIPDNVSYLDFWYHASWRDFEDAGEDDQDDQPDLLGLRLVEEHSDLIIAELAFPDYDDPYSSSGDSMGRMMFSVSENHGCEVRFEMELTTNDHVTDMGLIQIDEIKGIIVRDQPVGDFVSNIITFDETFRSFSVHANINEMNGTVSLFYRLDENAEWSSLKQIDHRILPEGSSNTFQYRIQLEGTRNEEPPVLKSLYFDFFSDEPVPLIQGQPESIGPLFGNDTFGIMNGTTLSLYSNTSILMNITSDQPIIAISSSYVYGSSSYPDIMLSSGDTVYRFILDEIKDLDIEDADHSFHGTDSYGITLHNLFVGSPCEVNNDGRVHLLPTLKHNLGLVDTNIENGSVIDTSTELLLEIEVVNNGLDPMSEVTLVMNITAPSYNIEEETTISLNTGEKITCPFLWQVPGGENVEYSILYTLDSDDRPLDNEINISVITKHHGLLLTTSEYNDSVKENGTASFHLYLENTGTFDTDDVSFDIDLPDDWVWWLRRNGENITDLLLEEYAYFELFVGTSGELGEYPITFHGISENISFSSELTLIVYVVDVDLELTNKTALRGDGKSATLIEDDATIFILEITNHGTQDTSDWNISVAMYSMVLHFNRYPGIQGEQTLRIEFTASLPQGNHFLTIVIDTQDEIKEYDEVNNILSWEVNVKSKIAGLPFLFRMTALDVTGEPISCANITIRNGVQSVNALTDDLGNAIISFPAGYIEGSEAVLIVETGKLYNETRKIMYSEDQCADVTVIAACYSYSIDSESHYVSVNPEENLTFTFTLTNSGNTEHKILFDITGIPFKWNMTLLLNGIVIEELVHDGIDEMRHEVFDEMRHEVFDEMRHEVFDEMGYDVIEEMSENPHSDDELKTRGLDTVGVILAPGESCVVTLEMTSWKYTEARKSYDIKVDIISTMSERFSNAVHLHPSIIPVENITVSTDVVVESGSPGDSVSHPVLVRNEGNIPRDIKFELEGDIEYGSLSKDDTFLLPGKETVCWLVVKVPNLENGTILHHEFYGIISEVGSTDQLDFYTIISISNEFGIEVEGEMVRITNRGNVQQNFTIEGSMQYGNVVFEQGRIHLDIGESKCIPMEIRMNDMTMDAGALTRIRISIHSEYGYFNAARDFVIPVVHNITLIQHCREIRLTGGSRTTIPFTVMNNGNAEERIYLDHSTTISCRVNMHSFISLEKGETREIRMTVSVPVTCCSGSLQVLAYSRDDQSNITFSVNITACTPLVLIEKSVKSRSLTCYYSLDLHNTGDVPRHVRLTSNYGCIDIERVFLDVDESVRFCLAVRSSRDMPEEIIVNAWTFRGEYIIGSLSLTPPPEAKIEVIGDIPTTILQPVELQYRGEGIPQWKIENYTMTGNDITYQFTRSGDHLVELTVTDERDLIARETMTFTINNLVPEIEIETDLYVKAGEYLRLDAENSLDTDGSIVGFQWSILENTYSRPVVYHCFQEPGVFNLTLAVKDDMGGINTTTVRVHVSGKNPIQNHETVEELDSVLMISSIGIIIIMLGVLGIIYTCLTREENALIRELMELEKGIQREGDHVESRLQSIIPDNSPGHGTTGGGEVQQAAGRVCDVCMSEIPASFSYCNKCGSAQKNAPVAMVAKEIENHTFEICTNCRSPVPDHYRYCNKCGVVLPRYCVLKNDLLEKIE